MTIYTGFPGASSSYVPSHEASGKLQVEFSRNPKDFALNKYVKLVPVKKGSGFYLYIGPENAGRVVSAKNDRVWADGQEAPQGDDNHLNTMYRKFLTTRYADAFNLGDKTVDQADWEILASYGRMAAQQSMTARSRICVTELTTAGNWEGNTDTCTNVAGGKLDVSTTSNNYIKNLFTAVPETILKNTYGVVKPSDLVAVMNPNVARQIAASPEMIDYLKQSPVSMRIVRGDDAEVGSANNWGLPEVFNGIKIVIEDAVYNSARPTAGQSTGTPTYVFPAATIVFLSRVGGFLGSEGVPNFSTVQIFSYEDMTVETKRDADNRRTKGRVVDDFDLKLVAPVSGYYTTACVD